MKFKFVSKFEPTGDQPEAIRQISTWLKKGNEYQTLLGVTGSGKTFTMAKVVEELQRPTLVISPNKTLAAQLYGEFKQFFPENAVHYFVSYYDYYQPEAYIPQSDTYIAKEAMINDEIDRLRHAATQSLLTRPDVLIVASVSCIYGLGSPVNYRKLRFSIKKGQTISRQNFLREIASLQYTRNDIDFGRGSYRVRGDIVEIHPVTGEDIIRFVWFGDTIESITLLPNLLSKAKGPSFTLAEFQRGKQSAKISIKDVDIYPAKHYVTPFDEQKEAIEGIRAELKDRMVKLKKDGKELEAQRLDQRTNYDLELIETTGYCNGIENYSRYFDGRAVGTPPFTLLDYFNYAVKERGGKGFLTFIDESHIAVPQIGAMYLGDKSRKQQLVEYGWRLPCAFDNRPLMFEEFLQRNDQFLYASATPKEYELKLSGKNVAEQLIRPTGIPDPEVDVRSTGNQLDDLEKEIMERVHRHERVLVTTLTKRLSEALTEFLAEHGIKVQYLHSDIETLERLEILKALRAGEYDVVVGINLLREGLDLPEVSLVAILDADKEGFLRNKTTLIQTMGRAARHPEGAVIMYADVMTKSMQSAIKEVKRRRAIQLVYNKKHHIQPHATERREIELIIGPMEAKDSYRSSLFKGKKTTKRH